MDAIKSWLSQLQFGSLADIVISVAAALICITFHELSHGYVAYRLGDPTAKNQGRLTLNPIKHIDIWGLLMMAILRFGWAKPVPVDMRYFKKPKRDMALTALAGPLSNILLAFVALLIRAVILGFGARGTIAAYAVYFLEYLSMVSVGLGIFNIIPIPPLDGSKILNALLPDRTYYSILRYERYGFLVLMLLMYSGILYTPMDYARNAVLNVLAQLAAFPYYLITAF